MINKKQKSQNISSYALRIPAQTKRKNQSQSKKIVQRSMAPVHSQVNSRKAVSRGNVSHEVAIDISDFSIEVLQLTKEKHVNAYGRCVLKENIVKDGIILDQEHLIEALKDVLRNTKPNNLDLANNKLSAVLSLPESRTFIHSFVLPKELRGDKLLKAVEKETARVIPFKQNRLRSDFITQTDGNIQRVLYAGVLNEDARIYSEALYKAGVKPILLDIEAASFGRALLRGSGVATMIVDIGARTTSISIFDIGEVLWMSVLVSRGGIHVTEDVADKLNISTDEAEDLKRRYGFNPTQEKHSVAEAICGQYEKTLREIKKACQYYEHKQPDKIESVILAGGSSLTPGIVKHFEQQLGRKVYVGDPSAGLSGMSVISGSNRIFYTNVIGLALRAVDDISKGINLLETSKHSSRSQNEKIRSFKRRSKILLKILKKRSVLIAVIIFLFLLIVFVCVNYIIPKA